jgi:Tfp pilus assembly PilM family ATPase
MLSYFGKHICPIGVDLGNGSLRLAQIGFNSRGPYLHAAGIAARPQDIEPQSPAWQRWAIDAIKDLWHKGNFKGKNIITALPSEELFIEQIKVPHSALEKLDEAVLSRIQKRLPFSPEDGMIRSVPVEIGQTPSAEVDVIVMAAERQKVDRHLAIYEKAGLDITGMSIWPIALVNSYRHFFCRRKTDQDRVVILMDIGTHHCNVVIGRGGKLFFARVIPTGYLHLSQGQMVQRLIAEIDACCRYFETIAGKVPIEQILLLVGKNVNKDICDKIAELAEKMQIPAHVGDVLSAVEMNQESSCLVDRRNSQVDWATAFGLSLEGEGKK